MSSNNTVLEISNSRKNVLSILEKHQGYDVSDYAEFSMHEIDAMIANNQLDMLVQHKENNKKTYVKYVLNSNSISKSVKTPIIDEYIDDLYNIEQLLTKQDTLIIIVGDDPNDTVLNYLKHLYNTTGVFVVVQTVRRLQFNILEHKLVPQMYILNDEELKTMRKTYNIGESERLAMKLPEISRFDPQAVAMCMRPGNVGVFDRKSVTAIHYDYFRICV